MSLHHFMVDISGWLFFFSFYIYIYRKKYIHYRKIHSWRSSLRWKKFVKVKFLPFLFLSLRYATWQILNKTITFHLNIRRSIRFQISKDFSQRTLEEETNSRTEEQKRQPHRSQFALFPYRIFFPCLPNLLSINPSPIFPKFSAKMRDQVGNQGGKIQMEVDHLIGDTEQGKPLRLSVHSGRANNFTGLRASKKFMQTNYFERIIPIFRGIRLLGRGKLAAIFFHGSCSSLSRLGVWSPTSFLRFHLSFR